MKSSDTTNRRQLSKTSNNATSAILSVSTVLPQDSKEPPKPEFEWPKDRSKIKESYMRGLRVAMMHHKEILAIDKQLSMFRMTPAKISVLKSRQEELLVAFDKTLERLNQFKMCCGQQVYWASWGWECQFRQERGEDVSILDHIFPDRQETQPQRNSQSTSH